MKIVEIRPFLVSRYLLVRVYTDEGLVGNGEAGLWAHHGVVCEQIKELSEYYVGKDPRLIEHHFQTVSRRAHFMGSALSAALSAAICASPQAKQSWVPASKAAATAASSEWV